MKYPMMLLVAILAAGCSNIPAGVGPSSPTEPSPVVVTPAPASSRTRPPSPPEVSPQRIGRLNPAVTQDTLATTVCISGWTTTVRPPLSYTNALKIKQLPAGSDPSKYEEDHLMPLGLGGAPRDPSNLWPVLWPRAKMDDIWETKLHRQLCAGEITLSLAQTEISAVKRKP